MNSRTTRYLNDPAFSKTIDKLITGDLDLLTIKKDERLHQVMDVMLGNTPPPKNETDYSGIVISDDEETEGTF